MGSSSSKQRRQSYSSPPPRYNQFANDSNPLAEFAASYSSLPPKATKNQQNRPIDNFNTSTERKTVTRNEYSHRGNSGKYRRSVEASPGQYHKRPSSRKRDPYEYPERPRSRRSSSRRGSAASSRHRGRSVEEYERRVPAEGYYEDGYEVRPSSSRKRPESGRNRRSRESRDTDFFDRPVPLAVQDGARYLSRDPAENLAAVLTTQNSGPVVLHREKYAGVQTWLLISMLVPCIGPFAFLFLFCPFDESNRQVVMQSQAPLRGESKH
eukprot:snap_masked-scaffold_53-processed-gene-1.46-mRNA-1 protein AED:1.00 eAED:1.00 QI:0/-1/0/0/-1/1/1/0/266